MYETLEYYDNNGYDLKDVLKSCIYKYYIANKNSKKSLKMNKKNSIIEPTNKVRVLHSEGS